MPILYETSGDLALRQGEVIRGLFETRATISPEDEGGEYGIVHYRIDYRYVIIITPDCDLDQDFQARRGQMPTHKRLTHVLLCQLFEESELRGNTDGIAGVFRNVKSNQHERFHRIENGGISDGVQVPELFADFKLVSSLPIEFAYGLINRGDATRVALLPERYVHYFIQRLYSFLGRIALD